MSYEAPTMPKNMRVSYTADGTAVYIPTGPPTSSPLPSPSPSYSGAGGRGGDAGESDTVTAGIIAGGSEVGKRKRGRPRKYSPDGSFPPPLTLTSGQSAAQSGDSTVLSPGKKRGRPRGSANKQHAAASGSPGAGFMPHILDVKAGEDVLAKLMWFSQNSTRALCILSASGAVSNVTLQQTATSGGTVTYEGRFEILTLSGSFMMSESGGQRSRTGGLSVALSGPDGRVLGGTVAGLLTAASPVQVIVGSFVATSAKGSKADNEREDVNAQAGGGSLSESSLGSPLEHSNNSTPQGMANMPWR